MIEEVEFSESKPNKHITINVEANKAVPTELKEVIPVEMKEVVPAAMKEVIPVETKKIIPEDLHETIPEDLNEVIPEDLNEVMPEDLNEIIPEDLNEVIPEDLTEVVPVEIKEIIPSMDEFKEEIARSFKKINEGDILKGTVIGISETEVILDLGYYTEGIIKLEELSNDPSFSIKADVHLGEEISAVILQEDDGQGNILLSRKRADDILAWDHLKEAMRSKKICRVKISQAVNAGVVTYLYGVRAFIPASQLSLSYAENLDAWVGKEIDVIVITANENDKKLVLSGKEVERDKDLKDKRSKISRLQVGIVTTGIVDKIAPYGAFVNIGEGLSGLLHISQICDKRIKSPSEVIKEGETITVKILEIKDGKISLSMKEVNDNEDVIEDVEDAPAAYSTGEAATTGLAALLKNFKF